MLVNPEIQKIIIVFIGLILRWFEIKYIKARGTTITGDKMTDKADEKEEEDGQS